MTIKQSAIHSIISAVLASTACLVYNKIYSEAFYVDFSKVMNPIGIIALLWHLSKTAPAQGQLTDASAIQV